MFRRIFSNTPEVLFFLYCISVCLGDLILPIDLSWLPFDVSFSFRPFMIITLVIFVYILMHRINIFSRISRLDLALAAFALIGTLELLTSYDGAMTGRYLLGFIVMFFSYLCVKAIAIHINPDSMIRIITIVGLIMLTANLIYYAMGLVSFGFDFHGNNVISYGVLLDRNFPRLISFASNDPNFTALIMSFFTFFLLHGIKKEKSIISKVGFILSILIVLLTLSRGAILALAASMIFYVLYSVKQGTIKTIFSLIGILVLASIALFAVNSFTNGFLFDNILVRFSNTANDGGSGRLGLWSTAIDIFQEHPITGIGLNNTLAYTGIGITHNTFLQVLSEMGIVGFAALVVILLILFKNSLSSDKANKTTIYFPLFICILVQMAFLCALLENIFFLFMTVLEASLLSSTWRKSRDLKMEQCDYDRA